MVPAVGEDVTATVFSREDRRRYRDKVKRNLDVFARMLGESRFEAERRSIGLEIELNLTDEAGDPAFANAEVLERIADDAFQSVWKRSGSTCWWSCTLVHAASGAIVSANVDSRSGPLIEIWRSSPRAAKICSLRSL